METGRQCRDLRCGKSSVRLQFWADDVVRVTLLSGAKSDPGGRHDVPLALDGCYGAPPSINVTDGDSVRIASKRLTVRVDKKPFRLHFPASGRQDAHHAQPRRLVS